MRIMHKNYNKTCRNNVSKKAKSNKSVILLMDKKAVSPLIATVLLIAFAVALGAVVMNWGRSYVEDTAEFAQEKSSTEITCSMDIRTEIIKIGETSQICYDDDAETLNFTIQNSGTVRVDGLRIQAIGNSSIVSKEINETFPTAEPKRMYINYSVDGNGSIRQVRFTPMITVEEKGVWCAQNVKTVEIVHSCQ
ncbi:hypothetical protein GF345_03055 [Candidatus Woesearchaeota archaeon]|nr:hypothetical protein [Candidatus Woesearchaeota archaeon]